jgi:hypothetical protein
VQVRDLVDQIRRVRDNKINQGLELVTGPLTAKLNNLCCMELNTLRPFFLGSLDRFLRISKVGRASQRALREVPNLAKLMAGGEACDLWLHKCMFFRHGQRYFVLLSSN